MDGVGDGAVWHGGRMRAIGPIVLGVVVLAVLCRKAFRGGVGTEARSNSAKDSAAEDRMPDGGLSLKRDNPARWGAPVTGASSAPFPAATLCADCPVRDCPGFCGV